jgi:hypothetical protein
MISKKKLNALYAKYMLGELTIDDLRKIVTFDEFSLGSNWYPVGKVKKRGGFVNIYMSGEYDDESVSIPENNKVKISFDIVRVMSLRGDLEIKIRIERNPFNEYLNQG